MREKRARGVEWKEAPRQTSREICSRQYVSLSLALSRSLGSLVRGALHSHLICKRRFLQRFLHPFLSARPKIKNPVCSESAPTPPHNNMHSFSLVCCHSARLNVDRTVRRTRMIEWTLAACLRQTLNPDETRRRRCLICALWPLTFVLRCQANSFGCKCKC